MNPELKELHDQFQEVLNIHQIKPVHFVRTVLDLLMTNRRITMLEYADAYANADSFQALLENNEFKPLIIAWVLVQFRILSDETDKGLLSQRELGGEVLRLLYVYTLITEEEYWKALERSYLGSYHSFMGDLMNKFGIPYHHVWGTMETPF